MALHPGRKNKAREAINPHGQQWPLHLTDTLSKKKCPFHLDFSGKIQAG
jgi:hypothetical protein